MRNHDHSIRIPTRFDSFPGAFGFLSCFTLCLSKLLACALIQISLLGAEFPGATSTHQVTRLSTRGIPGITVHSGSVYGDTDPNNPVAGVIRNGAFAASEKIGGTAVQVSDVIEMSFTPTRSGWHDFIVRGKVNGGIYAFAKTFEIPIVNGFSIPGQTGEAFTMWIEANIVGADQMLPGSQAVTPLIATDLPSWIQTLENQLWESAISKMKEVILGKLPYADLIETIEEFLTDIRALKPLKSWKDRMISYELKAFLEAGKTYKWQVSANSIVQSATVAIGQHMATSEITVALDEVTIRPQASAPVFPLIGRLEVKPSITFSGGDIGIFAHDLTDPSGSGLKYVEFYHDSNPNGVLELGVDTLLGTSSTIVDTSSAIIRPARFGLGTQRFFARVLNSSGIWSLPVVTVIQVVPPLSSPPTTERGAHLEVSTELRFNDPYGDRDGVPETGERITMQFHLRNESGDTLRYATAFLSTSESDVEVIGPDVVYGYLEPNQSSWSDSYFEVNLKSSSQRTVNFTLRVNYGVGDKQYFQEWNNLAYTFYPQGTFGPKFEFTRVEYVDSTGNPNLELESGEGGGFHVYLKNVGTALAKEITATIRNAPGFIQIHQEAVEYPDLPPNSGEAKGKVTSRFTFSSDIPRGFAGLATADLVIKVRGQPVEYVLPDLQLFRVKAVPWIGVSPGRSDFGVTPSTRDVVVTASVANVGSADLHISGITPTSADMQLGVDQLPWTIPPGHSKAFQVTLKTASRQGPASEEVVVASDGWTGSPDSRANKLAITGFVSDVAPPFRLPTQTAVSSGQMDADISGDTIVWTDHRNGNWDIYAFNLKTGKETSICTNSATQSRPRISGKFIAWTDARNARGQPDANDIYGYDLVAKQEFLISDDSQNDVIIGVDGGHVAFTRDYFVFTETSNWKSARNLFIYDHATRTAKNLTSFSANQTRSPMGNVIGSGRDVDFGGGLLVWSENTLYYRTDVPNAYWDSRDQKTKVYRVGVDTQPIEANNTAPGGPRSASKNSFVFRKEVNNDEQVFLWDNGTIRQITTERQSYAEEVLAFSGNFVMYDINAQTRPGIYFYDLSTSQESLLTDQKDQKPESARTDGNAVVWTRWDKTTEKVAVYVAYPQRPDISLSAVDIAFGNENPREGESIDIAVTVRNLSKLPAAKPITVRLFDGEPKLGESQPPSGTSGPRQITSDAGTLALYRCEEDSAQLTDSSSNSQHGTLRNGTSRGDSQTGLEKALVFDGVDDFVELPSDLLNNRPQGAVEALVYLDDYGPYGVPIISKGAGLTDFTLFVGVDGRVSGGNMGSGSPNFIGKTVVPLKQWTRVGFTWDGASWRIYINRELDAETSSTRIPNNSPSPLKLGHHAHSLPHYLHGRLDEIRFSSVPQPSAGLPEPSPSPTPTLPQAGQLGTDQVISGGIAAFGIAQVQFVQIPVGIEGSKRIYAAVYTSEEENPANNLAWKELLVYDIDETGPELFSKEVKEIPGNGDGRIDVGERARITYQLSDPSGVGDTELRLNGSLLPVQLEGSVYFTETQALTSEEYDVEIRATDKDRSPASSTNKFSFGVNPSVAVSIGRLSDAAEPNKDGGFVITRTGDSSSQIIVSFSVTGTTTQAMDYEAIPTLVTIPAGQNSVELPIKVKNDSQVEEIETVVITLTPSPGYTLGKSSSASLNLVDDDIPPAWVNRRLPNNYAPLVPLKVTVEAAPPAHTVAYGIEDRPPTGWAASMISDGGEFDSVNGKVKWTFLDKTARTLTYQVTPPQNSSGSQCFQGGEANVNGIEKSPVGGNSCVEPVTFHPADNNPADWKLTLAEVLRYATAFKRGEAWPTEPVPIPLSYVIRAFVLYKKGECYRFQSDVGSAPGWWISCDVRPQSINHTANQLIAKSRVSTAAGTAISEFPAQFVPGTPFTVKITVNPPSGGFAYGVEEKPPLGWVVSAINESGEFDALNGKVKWTFLDSTPRILTYQVTPPVSSAGTFSFVGTANFDGVSELTLDGQRTTTSWPTGPGNRLPNRPTNIEPVSGTSHVTLIVNLTASAFSDPDQSDTHKASQWVVVQSEDGREIVNREVTSGDLMTTTVSLPAVYATTYSWKVRYKDNHDAWSDYSDLTTFTTLPKPEPPLITLQPENQSVSAGANVVFSVTVSGSTPLNFQWRHNGQPIAGATASILELKNVQGVNQGDYDVVVTNPFGNVNSQIAKLIVSSGPPNDNFTNRTIVSGAIVSTEGSNVGATKQTDEPNHAGKPASRSVWWSWTAPGSGNAEISTKGSAIDTVLAVYTGTSISNLKSIANNDDDPSGGSTSRVTFHAQAGIEYEIMVDSFGGEVGAIKLSVVSDLGRPPLQAQLSGKNIVLSWPAGAVGFTLEASDSLDAGAWKPVAVTPVSVGENQSVKLPISEKMRFYRIRNQ